ncbi:sugar phosphate isomerase/epimerase family protein [Luteimicrobium sp. NPDC057192]|uniref:sugar phosphate isomerase/epimerase family protein n=1 Tax=Luteimicrobium sp. NPDC057192 TaxID=3346042 RepID=UPI0036254F9D
MNQQAQQSRPTGEGSHPLLSVQLYTVREALAADLPGTLARLAELGLEQVEPFGILTFDGLADGLAAAGLAAPTAHQGFLGDDPRAAFERARELGVSTIIDPFTQPERWQDAGEVRRIADQLASASEVAAEYGLRVGYHNHAHEVASVLEGQTALELLAANLPDAVALEVDTYWVAVGGADPVALLERLGDRVVALHVKDGPGTEDTLDQVAVGQGSLPVRDIIAARPDALRVVELDDSRGDRFQAVADSIAYLTSEGLA